MSGAFTADTFTKGAARLAGLAGAVLGWPAETFWRATPAELEAVVAGAAGAADTAPPPDAATLAKMREAFPDG